MSFGVIFISFDESLSDGEKPTLDTETGVPSEPTVVSRLSYSAGDLESGLLYDYGNEETVLVFHTNQLKANTRYRISWRIDSQYLSDMMLKGDPSLYSWYIPRSDDGKYYFMYQPSYVAYDSGFIILNAHESDSFYEASTYFTSGAEGDMFVLATLVLDSFVDDAEKGYEFILEYIDEIVIEEVV